MTHVLSNETIDKLSDLWGLLDDIMRYRVIRFQNFSDEEEIFADAKGHFQMLSSKADAGDYLCKFVVDVHNSSGYVASSCNLLLLHFALLQLKVSCLVFR